MQFVIDRAQLSVWDLQLTRQRLRLRQQLFRTAIRLDRIQYDRDTFRQLTDKVQVRFAKDIQGSQFNDRLYLVFKQHRQDNEVGGLRPAKTGVDLYIIPRNVR